MTEPRWARDPVGRYDLRWWDGRQWTRNVSSDAGVAVDQMPPPTSRQLPASSARSAPSRIHDLANQLRVVAGILEVFATVVGVLGIIGAVLIIASASESDLVDTATGASVTFGIVVGIASSLSAMSSWAFARGLRLFAEYAANNAGQPLN